MAKGKGNVGMYGGEIHILSYGATVFDGPSGGIPVVDGEFTM